MAAESEKIESLEEICKKGNLFFQTELLGDTYCELALNRKINCAYLGEKDNNGLYPCKYRKELLKLTVN